MFASASLFHFSAILMTLLPILDFCQNQRLFVSHRSVDANQQKALRLYITPRRFCWFKTKKNVWWQRAFQLCRVTCNFMHRMLCCTELGLMKQLISAGSDRSAGVLIQAKTYSTKRRGSHIVNQIVHSGFLSHCWSLISHLTWCCMRLEDSKTHVLTCVFTWTCCTSKTAQKSPDTLRHLTCFLQHLCSDPK